MNRPKTVVVLAISVDGKISDFARSHADFGSSRDKYHLKNQVALADAMLLGSVSLKVYGATFTINHPELLEMREKQGKPPQPIQIICSQNAEFDPNMRFFQQPVPRWLLTSKSDVENPGFDRILVSKTADNQIDWSDALQQLSQLGISQIAVLGGGKLVASLLEFDLVDEIWLTICPLILGGENAPTPVSGKGFLQENAPKLELLQVLHEGQEVFLHYRVLRSN